MELTLVLRKSFLLGMKKSAMLMKKPWFKEIIIHLKTEVLPGILKIRITAEDDDLSGTALLLQLFDHFETVRYGHRNIG
jgi:hypothetical protein